MRRPARRCPSLMANEPRSPEVNPSFLEKIVEANHCEAPIGGLSGKYLAHHDRPRMSAKIKFQTETVSGPDVVSNLQWQTTAEAKAKDRWERRACGRTPLIA